MLVFVKGASRVDTGTGEVTMHTYTYLRRFLERTEAQRYIRKVVAKSPTNTYCIRFFASGYSVYQVHTDNKESE